MADATEQPTEQSAEQPAADISQMSPADIRQRASELWPQPGARVPVEHELDRALTPAAIRAMWRNREITVGGNNGSDD